VIIVGPGELAAEYFPEVKFGESRPGGICPCEPRAIGCCLSGGTSGAARFYAVETFFSRNSGRVRWWTPWATKRSAPCHAAGFPIWMSARSQALNIANRFGRLDFDPLWKARNGANGEHNPIPAELGGCIKYKGFAHTFTRWWPPEKTFCSTSRMVQPDQRQTHA